MTQESAYGGSFRKTIPAQPFTGARFKSQIKFNIPQKGSDIKLSIDMSSNPIFNVIHT